MKALWKPVSMQGRLQIQVPTSSGLYAILRVPRVHGLPVEWEIAYVGKTLNLRRRFREHATPWRERSPTVRASAIYRDPNLEFWYRELNSDLLDRGERELIRRIQPTLNMIRYGAENGTEKK